MVRIDTLDEQILDELQANGRLTMKALAEHVGLSSPAMIERVRRLEERGVIAGYRAIVEPVAIGRSLMAMLRIATSHADTDRVVGVLLADPAVTEVLRLTGAAGLLARVHVSDTAALEHLIDAVAGAGGDCVAEIVLSTVIPLRGLSAPEGTVRERVRLSRRDGLTEDGVDDDLGPDDRGADDL